LFQIAIGNKFKYLWNISVKVYFCLFSGVAMNKCFDVLEYGMACVEDLLTDVSPASVTVSHPLLTDVSQAPVIVSNSLLTDVSPVSVIVSHPLLTDVSPGSS
jgi:hypothetical protein